MKEGGLEKIFLAANISMCSFYPCPRRSKNSHWHAVTKSAKFLCNSCRTGLNIIASFLSTPTSLRIAGWLVGWFFGCVGFFAVCLDFGCVFFCLVLCFWFGLVGFFYS